MPKETRVARWIVGLALASLVLTGCFKSLDGSLEPTPGRSGEPGLLGVVTTPEPTLGAVWATETPAGPPTVEEMTPLSTGVGIAVLGGTQPAGSPTSLIQPSNTPLATPVTPDGQGGMWVMTATPTPSVTAAGLPALASRTPLAVAALPSNTPLPTRTTLPSVTPLPTATPLPSATPLPTLTPLPSATNTRVPQIIELTPTFTPVRLGRVGPTATYTPYALVAGQDAGILSAQQAALLAQTQAAAQTQIAAQALTQGQTQPQVQPQVPQPTMPFAQAGEALPLAERTDLPVLPGAVVIPTETPMAIAQVMTSTPTLTANQMTATVVLLQFEMTQAAALGTYYPTPDPFAAGGAVPDGQGGMYITVTPGFGAQVFTPTPPGGLCNSHMVQLGETLYRIAAQYGVTIDQVAAANNITNPNLIQAGYTLDIPCPLPVTPTPIATAIVQTTTPGGLLPGNIYVVQAGDNLYRISLKFGVEMSALMAANGFNVSTMNVLAAGQQLVIPGGTVVATPLPTAAGVPGGVYVTFTPIFAG